MSERRAKALVAAALAWIVIVAVLAAAWRWLIRPARDERLAGETGSESIYRDEVILALDSFSGYCTLRSDLLKDQLRRQGIRLTVRDDGADYSARLTSLKQRQADMAVFTVDSLISAGAHLDDFPATIVLVLDETGGADAIVSYTAGVAQLQDLDHPSARIVLTPGSPSEFLARTVIDHFNLPNLPANWLEPAGGAEDVLRRMRAASKTERRAYVLWEPFVTKAAELPGAAVLIDSSRLKGFIVDVLVAERNFLREHPDLVRAVVEACLRTVYTLNQEPDRLVELIRNDAREHGAMTLDEAQAQRLAKGVLWKNTLENYAHFGLIPGTAGGGLPVLEDIIDNIAAVLVNTRALDHNPVAGRTHTLFHDQILRGMQRDGFHPAKQLNIIADLGPGQEQLEELRGNAELPELNDEQWSRLEPVGELKVPPVHFARGTARINVHSERELAELARRLAAWPSYYVKVRGHARAEGDAQANAELALQRARAAADVLLRQGLQAQRVRAQAAPPAIQGGEAQSVTFEVGQLPY